MNFLEKIKGREDFVFFAAIFVSVFFLAVFPISNFDLFWHLAFGKVQVLEKKILTEEIFSHTRNGTEWYNHTWLSGVVFYLVYSVGGFKGLILFKALIVSFIAILMSSLLRKRGYGFKIIFPLVLLMALSSLFRYLERPHLFTYFFIALTLYLLDRFVHHHGSRALLLILPFTSVFWVNLHSGVIFGVIILTVVISGEGLKVFFRERNVVALWKDLKLRYLFILLILFFIASLINPYGYQLYKDILLSAGSGGLQIAGRSVSYTASMGVEFLPPKIDAFPLFWLTLLVLLPLFIGYYKKIDITDLLLMLVFLIMALRYNRAIGMFNIVMLPVFASLLHAFLAGKKYRDLIVYISVICLLGLAFYVKLSDREDLPRFGLGLNSNYVPLESARFIRDKKIPGKMFNTEAIGGYLEWFFYPERKVFHDNRTTIFAGLYEEMHKPGMMEKYNINYGIVMRNQFPPQILFPQNKWVLIFWDKCCSVYIRRTQQNAGIINEYGKRYFRPGLSLGEMIKHAKSDGNLLQLIKEMEGYLPYSDNSAVFLALVKLYEETGKITKEKMAILRDGSKKWPESEEVNLALAGIYYRSGNKEMAKKYFNNVIVLGGGDEVVCLTLGYIAYDEGRFDEAVSYFMKALSYNRDFDQPYYGLGIAYEKSGDIKKAVKYLQEYVKRTSDRNWKSTAESKLKRLKNKQ